MKQTFFHFLKPLSFLPALIMMYVIYSFSAQDAEASGNLSMDFSYKMIEIGNDVFEKGLDEQEIEHYAFKIEHPVRKIAHMTEYFVLALTVSLPFYVYGLRGFPLMLSAGLVCVAFAAGDEYHQSFVFGRGPSVSDVGIDSVGVFLGILAVQAVCWMFFAYIRAAGKKSSGNRKNLMVEADPREGGKNLLPKTHSPDVRGT